MYEIMIIDDDSTSLAIGKALLESEYRVVLMKSGIQALGYLQRNPKPDLILLDMFMPGTNGLEILNSIKSDDIMKDIPVLFLSSLDRDSYEMEGYSLGAADFIQKPVVPELLKMKIERQIQILELKKENFYLRSVLNNIQEQIQKIPRNTAY